MSSHGDWIKYTMARKFILCWNVTQGIAFLLYPLFGWISDVCNCHYKMIKTAFVLTFASSVLMLLTSLERMFNSNSPDFENIMVIVRLIVSIIVLTISIGGLGLYEAIAIQFGMRQLFEASAEKLSAFIVWYYWSLNLGSLIVFYAWLPVYIYYQDCKIKYINGTFQHKENIHIFGWGIFPSALLQTITAVIGMIIVHKSKSCVENDQLKMNPFKTVREVLKYAFQHKYPEGRSAFTYWENTIPSRMDYGKDKYGGPFTNEEVEDVKTFLRLSLLILSLFGYFLHDDGNSLISFLIHRLGCPSQWTYLYLLINPSHQILLTILILIPIYQLLIKKFFERYVPKLLTRIWMGMFLCYLQEIINPIISYLTTPTNHGAISCGFFALELFMGDNSSSTTLCLIGSINLLTNSSTSECTHMCPGLVSDSYQFYLLAIPQVMRGLSSLLVFMTVLEFICAQSPHVMKGLLIGIWYSMFSIQYLGVYSINTFFIRSSDDNQWNIYNGIKGFCIFSSLALFSLLCKFYRYRERNEVVNEQAIIEEQYERELLNNSAPDE